MRLALILIFAAILWAYALAHDATPCGVEPDQQCDTDTQCECMHGADE